MIKKMFAIYFILFYIYLNDINCCELCNCLKHNKQNTSNVLKGVNHNNQAKHEDNYSNDDTFVYFANYTLGNKYSKEKQNLYQESYSIDCSGIDPTNKSILKKISNFSSNKNVNLFFDLVSNGLIRQAESVLINMSNSSNKIEEYIGTMAVKCYRDLMIKLQNIQYSKRIYNKQQWKIFVRGYSDNYVKPCNNYDSKSMNPKYSNITTINNITNDCFNNLSKYLLHDFKMALLFRLKPLLAVLYDKNYLISSLIVLDFMKNSLASDTNETEVIANYKRYILNIIKNRYQRKLSNVGDSYEFITNEQEKLTNAKFDLLSKHGVLTPDEINYITDKPNTLTQQ